MPPSHLYCTTCGAANQAQDAFCFACGRSLKATSSLTQYPIVAATSSTQTGFLTFNHLLKQRYRILEQLGHGGFGAVYKAEDIQFGNRLVAVKEMSQSGLQSQQEIDEAAKAFEREALMLAGLRHQHLPRIYDHFSDGGRWYLVMDFIEGETLEEHLKKARGGHLSTQEALQIGIQLCTVLSYLHTRQPPLIFRDLTPANVMLTTDGHLYLIDFGIARHFKPGKTKDTTAFGSPGYASPEQYGNAQTTPRSDIYSLGATLHHILTGIDPSQKPFRFESPQLTVQTIPASLSTLVMQMLNMDENNRPVSMNATKQELQQIAAQPVGHVLLPTQPVGGASLSPALLSRRGKGSFVMAAIIVVVIVVVGYSISAGLANHSISPSTPTTANSSSSSIITPTLAPALTPTATNTQTGTILYQADWSSGLNGWFGASQWKALNGKLVNDASQSGSILAPYMPNNADYTVEARFRLINVSPTGCSNFGIVARVNNDNQGYSALVTCIGLDYPYKALAEIQSNQTLSQVVYTPGTTWHTLRMNLRGNNITFSIDGTVVGQVTDNIYLSPGRVGLTSDSTQTEVSGFKIIAA